MKAFKDLNPLTKVVLVIVALLLGIIGAKLTATPVKHQKYFYIKCVDASGHVTYEAKSTEYPAGNILRGMGTCSYVWR